MRILSLVAIVALARLADAQLPSVDSLKQFLAHGNYVFRGIARQWNAVADSGLPAGPATGVVQATAVFVCPAEVGHFGGDVVTVQEVGRPHAPIGTTSWYFGTGWAIGQHVATSAFYRIDSLTAVQDSILQMRLAEAIHLGYTESVQAAATASDSIVIATVRALSGILRSTNQERGEHAEQWVRVTMSVDSIRTLADTSADQSKKFAAAWVASTRQIAVLVPYQLVYNMLGVPALTPGMRRLFFLDLISRRPNLKDLNTRAAFFIPDLDGIRQMTDVPLLGDALASPTFTRRPVRPCPQSPPLR